ncbi:MAG: hypothetical protein GXP08_05485 [Gammaproteobacteria bacterium]|nr:hypothetical protein [Gammaproteobacteria bacterium]
MNGIEFRQRLHNNPKLESLRIFALTTANKQRNSSVGTGVTLNNVIQALSTTPDRYWPLIERTQP